MANMNTMKDWGMALVVLGIMFGVGLAVLGGVADNFDSEEESAAADAVDDAIEGIGEFTGWFPLIALVVVAAIIIGLVTKGFGGNGNSRGIRGRRRGRA